MFGVSFTELLVIALVALLVMGPDKLPSALKQLGKWVGELRRMTAKMRAKTGIDELLRAEGIDGGVADLKALLHGGFIHGGLGGPHYPSGPAAPTYDPYLNDFEFDVSRERPPEGPDAAGALPDDLGSPEPQVTKAAELAP